MADLEEHALRRDKRFVVRLVVLLLLGLGVGLWIFGKLTSSETAACATRSLGDAVAPADTGP